MEMRNVKHVLDSLGQQHRQLTPNSPILTGYDGSPPGGGQGHHLYKDASCSSGASHSCRVSAASTSERYTVHDNSYLHSLPPGTGTTPRRSSIQDYSPTCRSRANMSASPSISSARRSPQVKCVDHLEQDGSSNRASAPPQKTSGASARTVVTSFPPQSSKSLRTRTQREQVLSLSLKHF